MSDTTSEGPRGPILDDHGVSSVLGARDVIGFSGNRKPLAGLIVRNTLLTLITFGIYRFWARTRIRQFYWNRTSLLNDRFEYTGRGGELFVGFLIVMVLLVPLTIIYQLLELLVITLVPGSEGVLTALYLAGIFWLIQFAYFRARRYRLTRTAWRGIHAGQTGSGVAYATRSFGWALANILTLGITVPWAHVALQRYEITNAIFGRTNFGYAGQAREVFRWWWPVLLCFFLAGVSWAALIFTNLENSPDISQLETIEDPELEGQILFSFFLFWGIRLLPGLVFALLAVGFLVRFRLAMVQYLFNVLSLAGARFHSRMNKWRVFIYWLVSMVAIVIPFVLTFGVLIALAIESPTGGTLLTGFPAFLLFIGFVLAFLFVPNLAVHLLFLVPFIRHVVETLSVENAAEIETIVQGVRDDPRFGEGLADAMSIDVGAI